MKKNIIRLYVLFVELMLAAAMLLGLAPVIRGAQLPEAPSVNLDVSALGGDSGTFAVGQKHTWILRGGIPDGLDGAKSYVLTHVLDSRLDFESGSSLVILYTRDGRQRPLRAKDHYQLEISGPSLRLALTPAGMAYAANSQGEGKRTPEICLSFRASINKTAAMGAAIPGKARLSYTDGEGVRCSAVSDMPEVHTGGIHLSVTDGETPQPGAVFRLARSTAGSSEDGGEFLYIDGEKKQVEFMSFYDRPDMSGEAVTELTTDFSGRALAYGLPYGEYYLVQTKASPGSKVAQPIPVSVNEVSHLTKTDEWRDTENHLVDSTITITNPKQPPNSAMGQSLFPLTGLYMAAAYCTRLLSGRR